MNLSHIASKLGLSLTDHSDRPIDTLLTDSRSLELPESTLFFAIPTQGNDGHRFVPQLIERGVRAFVVNKIPEGLEHNKDVVFLVVDDTIEALQTIARRDETFHGELIAITGSRGKTTLKEWLFQLLEPKFNIIRSPRSYNSQIGVPLSMWEVAQDTELAIIEAGISLPGEMKRLADCIRPDTVIITNIGSDHAEGFASFEEKTTQKILLAARSETRNIIFRADHSELRHHLEEAYADRNLLGWSTDDESAPLFIHDGNSLVGQHSFRYTFQGETSEIDFDIERESDIENAGNALAYMLLKGYSASDIRQGFKHLHKPGTRLNVSEGVNGCSIILDSYTSDFTSLRPAIHFMRRRQTPDQSSTLILSDLLHESTDREELYRNIATLIKRSGVNRLIAVGQAMTEHRNLFPDNSLFFRTTEELIQALTPSDFENEIILIKGSPEYNFSKVAEILETRKHETLLEVNLDSIVTNYNYFRASLPRECGLVCMVKASGYGAGSYEIAKTLQDSGAKYLAVAVLDEGLDLRRQGITMPIMVMNPKVENYRSMFANQLEPEIYSFEMLRDVIAEAKRSGITDYPVHIKLDTGMHRMGFVEEELTELMDILSTSAEVTPRSVFSHLATADCPDMDDYTLLQLGRFKRYTEYMLSRYPRPILRHILNSAGILRFPEHHYDMARLGIGLYGANTLPPEMEKPLAVVSTLKTMIISIREWKKGETIGYGRRGILTRDSRIATLPIGYADGMNRHFSRGAISVYVNGKMAPTVGNICMDACMIDVTDIECKVGDMVEIFGPNAPLQRLADTLDTIPYEILTSVSPRVKRVYYRE